MDRAFKTVSVTRQEERAKQRTSDRVERDNFYAKNVKAEHKIQHN
jgi:hypothetical protein